MKVVIHAAVLLVCAFHGLQAADTVRICTYNALKYNTQNEEGRNVHFQRVLDSIRPDILLCQEVEDPSLGVRFLTEVLTWTPFGASPFINGPDTDNQILFDQSKFTFVGQRRISTTLRDIAEFTLATMPTNGTTPDTVVLYSVHLKASNDDASAAQRTAEVRRLVNSITTSRYAVVAGDFNIYSPQEQAYTALVGNSAIRRFVDPIGTSWVRNDRAYAALYTQCTRKTTLGSCGGGVDGGVDDRFDYILFSEELAPRVVPGSYTAFGNDGVPRLNEAIDEPVNQRVSAAMAASLKCASDHLPVYVDIIIGDVQAGVEGAQQTTPWLRLHGTTLVVSAAKDHEVAMLYDIKGRLCSETLLHGPTARIDAGSLLPGVYALRVGSRWASFVMP